MPSLTWNPSNFPVGFIPMHQDTSINFQMNRLYNLSNDPGMVEVMRQKAPEIHNYPDLIRSFIQLSRESEEQGELLRAALFARGAEFYLPGTDSRKAELRDRFRKLSLAFYGITPGEHYQVPYDGITLSAYRFTPAHSRGTIIFLNGFDGYLEELLRFFLVFRDAGYDVIAFDGPGQGAVLEEYGIPMIAEWERPVQAVLNFFELSEVAVIGCSMGGGLAIRAAAYERRITRVICFDVFPDFFDSILRAVPLPVRAVLRGTIPLGIGRNAVNRAVKGVAEKNLLVEWGLQQGMAVTGTTTPFDFIRSSLKFGTRPYSHLVRQDPLLLAGSQDHYVPRQHLAMQLQTLTSARSITARMFTEAEQAGSHCQLGNLGLALTTMLEWLERHKDQH